MSNMLAYKGYHAAIEYDADDGILVGSVIGTRDILAFHGSSTSEIESAFHSCIDTYLEICERRGIEPDKEYKGSFNIRISPALHREAAIKAEEAGISLNQFIQQAIEDSLQPKIYQDYISVLPEVRQEVTAQTSISEFTASRYHAQPDTLRLS